VTYFFGPNLEQIQMDQIAVCYFGKQMKKGILCNTNDRRGTIILPFMWLTPLPTQWIHIETNQ